MDRSLTFAAVVTGQCIQCMISRNGFVLRPSPSVSTKVQVDVLVSSAESRSRKGRKRKCVSGMTLALGPLGRWSISVYQ